MGVALGLVTLAVAFAIIFFFAAKHREFALPLLAGFALRSLLAWVDAYVIVFPGHSDSIHYDFIAFYWSRNGFVEALQHATTGADLYTWVCCMFYACFERSQLMMQAVNVLFGTLILVNVHRLTLLLGGSERRALQGAWLIALFPSLSYFAAVQLREVAVAYPLSLGVLYLTRWYRDRNSIHMLVAIVSLLTSMAFHSGSVAVLLAAGLWMTGAFVRSMFTRGFRNLGRNALALTVGVLALAYVFSSGFGMQKFKRVEEGQVGGVSDSQTFFAKGRTAYLADLHPESGTDMLVQAPIRVVYFLFAPFPWMLEAPSDVVGVIDSLTFVLLFRRVWQQRSVIARRQEALLVLAVFGAMAMTFAMGVSNYGTALRHRNKMLPLLVAVGLAMPDRLRRRSSYSGSAQHHAERAS